ncbi:MAG: putative acyl-CoA transferases/carnitine dehydratase [uncultured archaeon A07HB70]|nr:MAG: putative acyl-CoA transferases/carnitine dehydratase [uncultured archaeon A07HB70]
MTNDDGPYAPEHDAFGLAPDRDTLPLEGITVVDAGTLVAAPLAAGLLADFGADVIKIEHPEYGDGLRQLAPHRDGTSLWWKVTDRNKRAVTVDMSTERGAAVVKDLASEADILLENFRPGTMEQWGLGYEELKTVNEALVMVRISGFGQTGPYAERPGFGRIAGAMSSMTNLIGETDGPPMTPGYPLADGVSGVFGALGALVALQGRAVNGGEGQEVDLALYESLFRLLEFVPIGYDQIGEVRRRNGNTHMYVAPSSTYETSDGEYLTMTATTPSIWERLCRAMDREDLLDDERFADNAARVEHSEEVNGVVRSWVAEHTREEVAAAFDDHDVAYGFAYDVTDTFDDEQYRARDTLVRVPDDELGEAVVQNVVPRLSDTPGEVDHLGPRHGEHTEAVLREFGYDDETIAELRDEGVV